MLFLFVFTSLHSSSMTKKRSKRDMIGAVMATLLWRICRKRYVERKKERERERERER